MADDEDDDDDEPKMQLKVQQIDENLFKISKLVFDFGVKLFKKLATDKNNNETISPISLLCVLSIEIFISFS
jgi:hypothetical protein